MLHTIAHILQDLRKFNYYTDNTQSQILKTVEAVERTNECFSIEGANWLYHKAKQQGIKCRCFLGVLEHNGCIYDEHAFIVLGDATLLEVDYTDWFGIHQYQSFNDLITDTVRQMYKHGAFGCRMGYLKGIWEYTPQDTAINIMDFYTGLFKNKPLYEGSIFEDLQFALQGECYESPDKHGRISLIRYYSECAFGRPYFSRTIKNRSRIYIKYIPGDYKIFGNGTCYLGNFKNPAYFQIYSKRYELLGLVNATGPIPNVIDEIVEYRKYPNFKLERYYEDILTLANSEYTLQYKKDSPPIVVKAWNHWKQIAIREQKDYLRAKKHTLAWMAKRYQEAQKRKQRELQIHSKAYRLRSKRELDNP